MVRTAVAAKLEEEAPESAPGTGTVSGPGAPALPRDWSHQRVHSRAELSLAVTLMGENNFYVGLSQNISEGGIFIATYRVLPLGTRVHLTFTLPGSSELLAVEGTVSWHRPPEAVASVSGKSIPPVKTGMGVQFDDPDMEVQEAIRAFTELRSPEFYD